MTYPSPCPTDRRSGFEVCQDRATTWFVGRHYPVVLVSGHRPRCGLVSVSAGAARDRWHPSDSGRGPRPSTPSRPADPRRRRSPAGRHPGARCRCCKSTRPAWRRRGLANRSRRPPRIAARSSLLPAARRTRRHRPAGAQPGERQPVRSESRIPSHEITPLERLSKDAHPGGETTSGRHWQSPINDLVAGRRAGRVWPMSSRTRVGPNTDVIPTAVPTKGAWQ